MKIDLSNIEKNKFQPDVMVGDIYPAKGGRGGTSAWLVVGVTEKMAHVLGLNVEGEIVSTSSYGVLAFECRERIGFVEEFKDTIMAVIK